MRQGKLLFVIVLIILTACAQPKMQESEPLLQNGGFEDGTTRDTLYWTLNGGPYSTQFGEIDGPEGWVAWWHEGPLCTGTSDHRMRRPEVKVISLIPDPGRVRSGIKAVQWFTFWGCHKGGLLQQVAVEPDHYYTFSVYGHSWFSNCSHRPHDPPYDYDCTTLLEPAEPELGDIWAQDWLSVGIDPTGGTDPGASIVEWGPGEETYGVYGKALTTNRVQTQGEMLTVFVKSEASHPLKHCDFYIDDAWLLDVTYQAFLPLVRR